MRKSFGILLAFFLILIPGTAYAQAYIPLVSPSVILVEQSTGKMLYGKNENSKMYPASMTKILTALVAAEYLNPDDIVTVGAEIYGLPADYATNIHSEGETITVRNLLRALMIASCNETGSVLAVNTVRAMEGRYDIPFNEAERRFIQLMNEKAISLGALSSNFNNTYGLHSEGHFTTAADMALIARAYMGNDLLASIAAERNYIGDSLEGRTAEGARVNNYEWENHNELLLGGTNGYQYATGIKTGFTDEAGDCLAASATRNGLSLISVVFFSEDPGRWQDSRLLLEYGFETYDFRTFQEDGEVLGTMTVADPRLGETDTVQVLSKGKAEALLSEKDLDDIEMKITYDPLYISDEKTEDGADKLVTPIDEGMPLGTVQYTLRDEVLFSATVHAASGIPERTFDSDMDYYILQIKENIFTLKGLPYWFGAIGLLVGIIGICVAAASRRGKRERFRGSAYRPYKGGRRR